MLLRPLGILFFSAFAVSTMTDDFLFVVEKSFATEKPVVCEGNSPKGGVQCAEVFQFQYLLVVVYDDSL